MIKEFLKRNSLVSDYLRRKHLTNWISRRDTPGVPHAVKQLGILYHAVAHDLHTLVETGTYLGDTVWAQKEFFTQIFSIELSEKLHRKALRRFAGVPHVKLIQGDSAVKIAEILEELSGPALFWLDGHYSGGITAKGETVCPIYGELDKVLASDLENVILIDDARLFVGADDYPTLTDLAEYVKQRSSFEMRVENDMIILSRPSQRYI